MRLANVVTVLVVFLLAACSGGDTSPAALALKKQLVGHWATTGDDNLYYGEIDPGSKIGAFVMVHPDGKVFTHRYKVESTDAGKRSIKTTLLFATGDSRGELIVIANDGATFDKTTTITGIEVQSRLTRVDDKTAP